MSGRHTKLAQKIALFCGGILFAILLLEMGLRLGGWIFLNRQERANQMSLAQEGEYRILCLGESTTALGGPNAYPRQLEDILNASPKTARFTVINKGVPAITTTHILVELPKNIERYQPHIVVTMIGINDGPNFPLNSESVHRQWERLLLKFRVYKLVKLLAAHIHQTQQDKAIKASDENLARIEAKIDRHPSSDEYSRLAGIYRIAHKYDDEERALQKALKFNPRNYEAWGYLGYLYKRHGQYDEAVKAFQKAVGFSPAGSWPQIALYAYLGESYKLLGNYQQAEKTYVEAMTKNPSYTGGLGAIGDLYLMQEKYAQAKALFQRQVKVDPLATEYYQKLAHCYMRDGEYEAAEQLLKYGIVKNPKAAVLYAEWGSCLIDIGKYAEAEVILKKALDLDYEDYEGTSINIYGLLYKCARQQGNESEARKWQRIAEEVKAEHNPTTQANYRQIRDLLEQKGIGHIAMQYPLRDIAPLKKMLAPNGKTIFVDNQGVFNEALASHAYDYYFTDRFAGDFGHCNARGNRIIAQNLADVILQQFALPDDGR